jgi:hypothetical protein
VNVALEAMKRCAQSRNRTNDTRIFSHSIGTLGERRSDGNRGGRLLGREDGVHGLTWPWLVLAAALFVVALAVEWAAPGVGLGATVGLMGVGVAIAPITPRRALTSADLLRAVKDVAYDGADALASQKGGPIAEGSTFPTGPGGLREWADAVVSLLNARIGLTGDLPTGAKGDGRPQKTLPAALLKEEDPFAGRYYGAVNVEGESVAPSFMFGEEEEAWRELKRRQALPNEDDDWLSEDWSILTFDVEGLCWNSYDRNPRPAPTTSRLWELQCELEEAKRREEEARAAAQHMAEAANVRDIEAVRRCGAVGPDGIHCTRGPHEDGDHVASDDEAGEIARWPAAREADPVFAKDAAAHPTMMGLAGGGFPNCGRL